MTWTGLLVSFLGLSAIIAVRYFLVAGLFYWLLWRRNPDKVRARRLAAIRPDGNRVREEIWWSVVTTPIYALPAALILEGWKAGGTAMYSDVGEYGWGYLLLSIVIYLFLHDTYFYWTHRWMHRPRVFRSVHKVHHLSRPPTPWAAFAFHPYEAVIGAVFLPLLALLIPIHVGVALFILMLMTLTSVLNHTGYEVYPDRWLRGLFGRNIISACHHNLHHQHYNCNYALYFRFWDKLMATDRLEDAYEFLRPRAAEPAPAAGTPDSRA